MIKGRMSDVLINVIKYDITAIMLTHFWTIILCCIKDKGVKITRSVPKGMKVTNLEDLSMTMVTTILRWIYTLDPNKCCQIECKLVHHRYPG